MLWEFTIKAKRLQIGDKSLSNHYQTTTKPISSHQESIKWSAKYAWLEFHLIQRHVEGVKVGGGEGGGEDGAALCFIKAYFLAA